MKIERSGTQPSAKGRADWFSGTVQIDPLFGVDWLEHVSDEQYAAAPKK